VGSAILATIVAGLYPAWRVCRVPPAAYLRLQ
jgi:ABC-type lipoprotein release transport system permease subunit